MSKPTQKRPNNILVLIASAVISLPVGLFMSNLAPEGSPIRVVLGFGGIAAPCVAALVYSSNRWQKYINVMLAEYEESKKALRRNPSSIEAREEMLRTGRAYYSCLREDGRPTIYDEQAVSNDLKAIVG
mgnify:CR=1 FL=1